MIYRELDENNLSSEIKRLEEELNASSTSLAPADVWAQSLLRLADMAAHTGASSAAELATSFAASLGAGNDPNADAIRRFLSQISESLRKPAPAVAAPTSCLSGLATDPELLADFILESREHLSAIEQHLLTLERDSETKDAVHAIFRGFHTIKGLAGFLEFALIQSVAHEVESLLDSVRQGDLSVSPPIIDAVLEGRDYIAGWLTFLESDPNGTIPRELLDPSGLIARVHVCNGASVEQPAPVDVSTPEPSQAASALAETPVQTALEAAAELLTDRTAEPAPQARKAREAETAAAQVSAPKTSARSIKVNTDKLDYLVDMVGELVITQSLVRCDIEALDSQNQQLTRNLSQLGRITADLQRTAMAMRMVPVGSLFQKMARLVRDLGRKFNKPIEFETEGEDVELDRNIVEELADPLMHMVRNAVDHGIETNEQRLAAGKACPAKLILRAYHRAGHIVIEVSDDGRGIHREKVLAKAIDKRLVSPGAVLSDNEVFNLIFHPGFSTAENVSDISGRGVGMDVVRKQITRLRGQIDIVSAKGKGTTFSLRLPLTLAIIDGLVVIVGSERFIIPLAAVRELLRPKREMLSTVEGRAELVSLRNQMLPMVRLHERFGIEPKSTDPAECVLVVADTDETSFCLMVDEMAGKQEVVIKSLGKVFQRVRGVAGGAILGDGHVGLILDLNDLFGAQKNG